MFMCIHRLSDSNWVLYDDGYDFTGSWHAFYIVSCGGMSHD